MELIDVLEPQCFAVSLQTRTQQEVLRELGELAAQSSRISGVTAAQVTDALAKREAEGSTGYGGSIAIPHARMDNINDFVIAVAVAPRGVDFAAVDGKRVRVFFLIIGPADRPQDYLKLLAAVSRLLVNTRLRKELLHAATSEIAYETFARWCRTGKTIVNRDVQMLLTVVLYEEDLLYPLLNHFVEMGIEGATIYDSHGMNEYISQVPLYAELIQFMSSRKSQSKTLQAIVPEDVVDDVMRGIEEITGNLDQVEGAVVYVQELRRVRGTMKMLE